jgi:hypothetical protein
LLPIERAKRVTSREAVEKLAQLQEIGDQAMYRFFAVTIQTMSPSA